MKVAIFGAGAIGGMMGVKLAAGRRGCDLHRPRAASGGDAGERRHHAFAGGETIQVRPRCVGTAAEAGRQDYVVVTLKAHSLPAAAADIALMMDESSALITAVNGVPYWYFHGLPGPYEGRIVQSVDPGGILSATLPPACAIGCVVYPAAEVTAPGIIEHGYGDRFSLGEPDGSRSPRIEAISQLLISAGLKAPIRPKIRDEIWVKLWGNLCFNPLSALTGATLDILTGQPDLRAICRSMMLEGQAVAEALGAKFAISVDKRIDGAAEVGVHKTSMLQDLERGRPMEIDALLGAVVELGHLTGLAMPACELVLALVRQRARVAGCY